MSHRVYRIFLIVLPIFFTLPLKQHHQLSEHKCSNRRFYISLVFDKVGTKSEAGAANIAVAKKKSAAENTKGWNRWLVHQLYI